MKCDMDKVVEMDIFVSEYSSHPTGYGFGNNLKPEVRVRVQVWAKNIETGVGLGTHYPYPYSAGAMLKPDPPSTSVTYRAVETTEPPSVCSLDEAIVPNDCQLAFS